MKKDNLLGRSKIPEKIWKAEMLIRGEGYTKYSQPQRIGKLKNL